MSKKSTFEQDLNHLETIVQALEKGNLPLDDALKQFEQGMKLAKLCQKTLTDAQSKVDNLISTYALNDLTSSASTEHD